VSQAQANIGLLRQILVIEMTSNHSKYQRPSANSSKYLKSKNIEANMSNLWRKIFKINLPSELTMMYSLSLVKIYFTSL